MEDRTDRNTLTTVLAGIGLGAIVGAAVALLFAPKAGTETRDDVCSSLEDLKDKAEKVAGDLVSRAEELVVKGKETLDTVSSRVKEAVAAGREAMDQAGQEEAEDVSGAAEESAEQPS